MGGLWNEGIDQVFILLRDGVRQGSVHALKMHAMVDSRWMNLADHHKDLVDCVCAQHFENSNPIKRASTEVGLSAQEWLICEAFTVG